MYRVTFKRVEEFLAKDADDAEKKMMIKLMMEQHDYGHKLNQLFDVRVDPI